MKAWIFVTLVLTSFQAGAQSVLPVPGDYTPPAATPEQRPPAVKPLDPETVIAEEPQAAPQARADVQARPRAEVPKAQKDPWTGQRQPVPQASRENEVYLKWISALEMCVPREGASHYEIIPCPSYAVAGIRYALEDPSLRAGLSEFDWVQTPLRRNVTLNRIYGTLKNAVTYETGVQAAACVSREGALTQCVIGRRNAVLSWIRTAQ